MKLDKGGGETKAEDCHKVNLGTMKGPIKGPEGNHNPHNNGGTFTWNLMVSQTSAAQR